MKKKLIIKRSIQIIVILFILLNVVANFHAYKFTHYSKTQAPKTQLNSNISLGKKLSLMLFGVNNPRPTNTFYPTDSYATTIINWKQNLEIWEIKRANSKGTIIMFHGYGGKKSDFLLKSSYLKKMGFNTLLVDFAGSGGSEGNNCSIGFKEAEQVKAVYDYYTNKGYSNLHLFGTSMGAVAIIKCLNDYPIHPNSIVLECPFGDLQTTVKARFKKMGAPTFPLANLLVFWGGIQNGFNGFKFSPINYAKNVHTPTLLLYGLKDDRVSLTEINQIYANLGTTDKTLKTFEKSGHNDYLETHLIDWVSVTNSFLDKHSGH